MSRRLSGSSGGTPSGTKARLALACYYGRACADPMWCCREQDARDGWLKFTQQKNRNRNPVMIEIYPLRQPPAGIDKSPTGDLTYLVSERRRPFRLQGSELVG